MEVLAPCGKSEAFEAAVNAGADAVYLGLKNFSARKSAENFEFDELEQIIKRSRLYGMKVYLTLNTIVFDDELSELREYVPRIRNVDAVIVADLGVASILREAGLRLHASTQMTVTSVKSARQLKELGFSRVVLARELSCDEIHEIVEKSAVEVEVFVHGAHCVCVSGQCYMSALFSGGSEGSRSGNRGSCAQPCRLDFRDGQRRHALSMKDLSLIPHIQRLREIGVSSLKIEGRMKRPEYVAAAVDACKKAIAGQAPDMQLLEKVFSRSGFTDGYFMNDYSSMDGVRTKEDVLAMNTALKEIKSRFNKPYKRYVIDFHVTVKSSEFTCTATVEALNGLSVAVSGEVPQKAINKSITEELVINQISKLGGTVFKAGKVTAFVEDGLSLSCSSINDLRRCVITKISEKIEKRNTKHDKSS
jgi:putative protease